MTEPDRAMGGARVIVVVMDDRVAGLGTILSVWAHPDDETYLAGGLMTAAVANGQRVVCVAATAGELGTDDPVTWPPARLAAVRRLEATAAMAVLGVREHRILDLPDGGLAGLDETGSRLVAALVEEVRPDTVVTFGADGMTFHSDHIAVHRWVTGVWRARRDFRLLHPVWTAEHLAHFGYRAEVFMTDARPVGVPAAQLPVRLELTGPDLDRKVTALRAMATQTTPLFTALGADQFAALVAEEGFIQC